MNLVFELSQKIGQEISLEQRIAKSFSLRLKLIKVLRGEKYHPQAECPQCHRKLKIVEILRGFNRDPKDYTTKCPHCKHRFEPNLQVILPHGSITLPFFCSVQTLDQLHGKENLFPDAFEKQYPALYRSVIVHHGNLKAAFQKIGIHYRFNENIKWEKKVKPFLGLLPDTVIAACAGISVYRIRKMRRGLEIGRYR